MNLEYEVFRNLVVSTAINYSNKDFTGTYYCHVCDLDVPSLPQDVQFRFVEVPLTLKYYFLPNKFRLFGELGINDRFLLKEELTHGSMDLGLKLGGGFEYALTDNIALQWTMGYTRGMTNLFNDSDFKLNTAALGIGLVKRL